MAEKDKTPTPADELKSMDLEWRDLAKDKPRHPCPCCDYVTLSERGEYFICPVCYWEDDLTDVHDPDRQSDINDGLTLRQARENFQQFGAYAERMVKNVCSMEERKAYELKAREIK